MKTLPTTTYLHCLYCWKEAERKHYCYLDHQCFYCGAVWITWSNGTISYSSPNSSLKASSPGTLLILKELQL